MVKKRINLFPEEAPRGISLVVIRKITAGLMAVFIVLFLIFVYLTWYQVQLQLQKQKLAQDKEQYTSTIASNHQDEARASYFLAKEGQLKTFLQDDAEFLPYYNLLNQLLNTSVGEQPVLESMTIDKKKITVFVVRFKQYQPAYEFLKYIESPNFLDNFISLKLDNFNVSQEIKENRKGYELQFEGKFKVINGAKS